MLKGRRLISILLIVLITVGSITGCSNNDSTNGAADSTNGAAEDSKKDWPSVLKVGASQPGGYSFLNASGMCEIINATIEGVTATPTTGGQVICLNNCNSGEFDLGLACNYTEVDARLGNDPFEEPLTNVSSIGNCYPSPWHIITLEESNINSIEDLRGKDFSPGTQGMGGEVMARRVLSEYGMTYDDLGKMTLTGYEDGASLMKDGHIEAFFIQMLAPSAPFVDVGTFKPLKILSVGEDRMDEICEKYNMFPGVIPAGTYPGQKEDVMAPSATNEFIAGNHLPEDLVYEITKAFWENIDQVVALSEGFKPYFKVEQALDGLGLPLHKGAYKYYVEIGLDVPEHLKPAY